MGKFNICFLIFCELSHEKNMKQFLFTVSLGLFITALRMFLKKKFYVTLILMFVRLLKSLPDINECLTSTCSNGGTCVDQYQRYSCNCTERWLGQNCTGNKYCTDMILQFGNSIRPENI